MKKKIVAITTIISGLFEYFLTSFKKLNNIKQVFLAVNMNLIVEVLNQNVVLVIMIIDFPNLQSEKLMNGLDMFQVT